MKYIFTLFPAFILLSSCGAQMHPTELSGKLARSFETLYPAVHARKLYIKDSVCTVFFTQNKNKMAASFDIDGEWMRTESVIPKIKQLPPDVKRGFFNSQFAAWYVEMMQKEETATDTVYRITVNNGNLLDGDHFAPFFVKYRLDFSTSGELQRAGLLP